MAIEQEHLSERERRLGEIVFAYLQAVERGQHPCHRQLLTQHPEFAHELAEFFAGDNEVERLAAPLRIHADRPPPGDVPATDEPTVDFRKAVTESAEQGSPPGSLDDYELLAELGRGGMGVVYKARQKSLNRLVALKTIRSGLLSSPGDLQRFRNEAATLAALDHPHILPIYEVGEHQGCPYFTLKLVEGGSLASQLDRFGQDPRAAVSLVASLADAVHHAHHCGVLHRDLKPSNIVLDTQGQPYLTDFGVAKHLTQEAGLTQTGQILGTPAYMAPEQVSGKETAVSPATDVYGLGAVLYALLTGRAPFHGSTVLSTIEQVTKAAPHPPRCCNRRVDRDLQIICLKCLEKDPRRRYYCAAALREDLLRWLAGKPIEARAVGAAGKAWRFCRRSPLVAGLAAGLVLTLLVASAVATWQWRRAENSRRQAEDDFRKAHAAVREFHALLDEDRFDAVEFRPLREAVLERVLQYYHRFLEYHAEDPSLRADVAEAHYRIGFADLEMARYDDAMPHFQQSLLLWEALAREEPQNLEHSYFLAKSRKGMGIAHSKREGYDDALRCFRQAEAVLEPLVPFHSSQWPFRRELASCQANLGTLYSKCLRRPDEALPYFVSAAAFYRSETAPDPQTQHELAETLLNIGSVHLRREAYQQAADHCEQARQILEPLVEQKLRLPWSTADLARTYRLLGEIHRKQQAADPALEWRQKALTLQEGLVRDYPTVLAFRDPLANICFSVGTTHLQADRPEQAVACLRRTCELREQWLAETPDDAQARSRLVRAYRSLGNAHQAAGQHAEAVRAYQREIELREQLLGADSGETCSHIHLVTAYSLLASCLEHVGRLDEAHDALAKAEQHRPVLPAE